jgi:N-methylhydantoinase B
MDAVDLEVFRHAVASIVDELEINITRTASSQLVYEFKDYCVGLLDDGFRLIGTGRHNLPGFLASMAAPVADAVQLIGAENLEPGDVFISNHAPSVGQHLNHVVAASPIFSGNEIAAYCAIQMHWVDVGGLVPTSMSWDATSLFHEGIQYRGLRVMRRGEWVPEAVATVAANTWMPGVVTADMHAQVYACRQGAARWREQVDTKWSAAAVRELIETQLQASAALARSRVQALPNGLYTAVGHSDDAGAEGTPSLELPVRVRIEGDQFTVDFSGLPAQVEAPINSGINGGARAAARTAFQSLVMPDRAPDEGVFEALKVEIPPGTIASATGSAPMSWWNQLIPTYVDLILRAIGTQHPKLVPAGHHGGFCAVVLSGEGAGGQRWACISGAGGGFGASADADGYGPLKTMMHGDTTEIPVELLEAEYPVLIRHHRLKPEAAGRGTFNGGPATEKLYEVLRPCTVTTAMSRTLDPAWGLAGGEPGQPGAIHIKYPGTDEWVNAPRVSDRKVQEGTLIRLTTGGGGGWGPPKPTDARIESPGPSTPVTGGDNG